MTSAVAARHVPVLIDEVIVALAIAPGETHVDGTFGAGGYTTAMLEAGATVHAFDQDPDAIAAGQAMVDGADGKLHLHHARYSEMADVLVDEDIDGITLDIGVSSMQLDQAERGFSFQKDGPLDMRMARDGESAADFLNEADEETIADVIYSLWRGAPFAPDRQVDRRGAAADPDVGTGAGGQKGAGISRR